MNSKTKHIVIAILLILAIISIPLTIMIVGGNASKTPPAIEDNSGNNAEVITPNDSGNNGNIDADNGNTDSGNDTNNEGNTEGEKEPETIRVTLTIDASALFGEAGKSYMDAIKKSMGEELFLALNEGKILVNYEMTLEPQSSVMRAIKKATDDNNIPLSEYNGYIGSIAGLSDKRAGKMSGWVYVVNDKTIMLGASSCVLNDGDHVKWMYRVGDR